MQLTLKKAIKITSMSGDLVVLFKYNKVDLNMVYFSEGVAALYGYSTEEFNAFKDRNVFSFVSDYDVEYIKRGLMRTRDTDEDYLISVQVRNKSGSLSFFGGVLSFLGSEELYDIFLFTLNNDKKKLNKINDDKLLEENEKLYKDAIDFAEINTWELDLATNKITPRNFIDFPLISENMSNYPESGISMGVVDAEGAALLRKAVKDLKDGVPEVIFDCWYHIPKRRTPIYVKNKYINVYDKNGKPIYARGMSINLSEQKNAELNFTQSTNAFLRMSPDSVLVTHMNVSENKISGTNVSMPCFNHAAKSKNLDELIANIVTLISDTNESVHFINAFSRSSILSSFVSGVFKIKLEHHLTLKANQDCFVRTVVNIIKNPVTNDVEAVMNITNIHYLKTVDSLITGTVHREFDFVALAFIKRNSYIMIDRFKHEYNEEQPEFINFFRSEFSKMIFDQKELEYVLSEFTIDNLVDKINSYGEYTIQFNTSTDPEKNHHRILRFSFLNNKREIIAISCRDTTRLYNEEVEQKNKLSKALQEAEMANKAKSEFLSLVSHDIRTPLNGIMGMMQLAQKEECSDKIMNYLSKAEMSSSFLLGLINDLLDMSKIECGKIELHPEVYCYKEFTEYINSIIKPLCQKKNLDFSIHVCEAVPYIMIDKLRFNQIMFNLLSNACKYTNEGGFVQLKINTERVNDSLCIGTFVIKDNGIGMSEEFQYHLFETFAQENRMTFDHNEGTGLGLSITHSLIELMGGEITVDSEINKGTTFTVQITFPYFESLEDSLKDSIEEEPSFEMPYKKEKKNRTDNDYTGFNFLLCEDNVINQEIALEILQNLGASVDVAEDGQIGVEMFKNRPAGTYDGIFMDIRMPNLDGLSASKEIRACDKEDALTIPIIAMTANAMSEDKMECIEAGMNAFIAKPINIKELYKTMNDVI